MQLITNLLVDKCNLSPTVASMINSVILFIAMVALAILANIVAKHIILRAIRQVAKRSKTSWDDILITHNVFTRLSHLAPAIVIFYMAHSVFDGHPVTIAATMNIALVYMAVIGLLVIDSFLNAVIDIYRTFEFSQKLPIRGFIQVAKIIIFFIAGISILSIILGKNPGYFLGGMGAMTAVLMLIFKDSILGFVAGIQLSTNRMLRLGDWIEMPKFGADGDVIDISLTTVKVQNWDKTIASIPTYSLISGSFKNWRGMSESGGRRICRSINIDMTSVKFCSDAMIEKFKRIEYIRQYIEAKTQELAEANKDLQADGSELVNGRRLTNLGTFRAYIVAYLRHHPKIHQEMTFLVRQLQPDATGIPIQIYIFSNEQRWAHYEDIQADIFDHILAVLPQFDLKVFQNPTGSDFQKL